MRMAVRTAALAAFTASGLSMAAAQDSGRYTLQPSGDGFVRMDTLTGDMTLCEERDGQLVCRMAADERAAFQDELDRLEDAVTALRDRVAELEGSTARRGFDLPSAEDFDQTLSYMEEFFRRFMGVVQDLDRNLRGAQPDEEAVPQRT